MVEEPERASGHDNGEEHTGNGAGARGNGEEHVGAEHGGAGARGGGEGHEGADADRQSWPGRQGRREVQPRAKHGEGGQFQIAISGTLGGAWGRIYPGREVHWWRSAYQQGVGARTDGVQVPNGKVPSEDPVQREVKDHEEGHVERDVVKDPDPLSTRSSHRCELILDASGQVAGNSKTI